MNKLGEVLTLLRSECSIPDLPISAYTYWFDSFVLFRYSPLRVDNFDVMILHDEISLESCIRYDTNVILKYTETLILIYSVLVMHAIY